MKINFNSITIRTILHISIFTITFILFVTFVVKNLFTDSYMNLEKDKVAFISSQISDSIALNLSYDFEEAVGEIANTTLSNPNVLLINVYNDAIDTNRSFSKHTLTLEEHRQNKELIHTQELLDPATGALIGKLSIAYSNDTYEEYMNRFNIWFFWGIVGFTFSLILLSYLLYKSLKNLSLLDIALKNFNPQKPQKLNLPTSNKDEIYSISKSANIMIDNIIEFLQNTKNLNTQLLLSQAHLQDAQRIAKVGSFDYDIINDTLILSDEYYRILGVKNNPVLTWKDFISWISEEDYKRVTRIIETAITKGSRFSINYSINRNDGKSIHILTKGKVRKHANGMAKITAVSMDVTSDVQNKKIIEKLAYFDALTGLANRTLLKDRMLKSIQQAERSNQKTAVLFLDLDHFKLINDTLGHSVGDELLLHIANILKSQIRDSDTLSRLGGDEFVILLPNIKSIEDIEKFASKVRQSLDYKHTVGTHQLYITSSIGVAVYPEHGTTSDILIRNADTAMYEAKTNGRNRFKLYSPTMGDHVDKQHTLEQDLTGAVKTKDQIQVYYQVKIDTVSKDIIGAEALVRWHHPVNGLIFPDDFIYMAESTGLMLELGNIIIEKSMATIVEINKLGFLGFKMAINLSARQFQNVNLVDFISKTIDKYNLDPAQIEFEITETLSMTNHSNTLRILKELRAIGVSIAIDDFGTGYSSLAYLKKFPINTLKIDKSFIMDIVRDEEDKVIAQTIISMAHSLGLTTVAEGVETQEHVSILESMDCDTLQGYFYSKPLPYKDFHRFLQEYKINN